MAAYMIFIRERIHDPEQLSTYGAKAARSRSGAKRLAMYGRVDVLEGPAADGVVILEFPNFEAAQSWYRGPAYQEAVRHRRMGADYRVMIIEGVEGAR